ncbi:predicted signal-transduction protein containing cAMP-binding and CBS domains [Longilinea arvoryzae]|uniref:Predicted signal-transduction protein containing cAMP-binding and CBS domains n=1 Tax=Longilinea arvoryzae TaxID=360412 RepID=A0A0S7BPK1_9CHLR|nr:CBS domain-containing protein [Longilinea arvoryzae]GAP15889.1 predicted signal-transduction protein containing cAMP-binding and CBS domains [Longilinea arvoryzae]
MYTVNDLLKIKGRAVWTCDPHTSLLDALKLMAEKNIGALLVKDGERVVGIVSERDVARRIAEVESCPLDAEISEFMTLDVIVVRPDQSTSECMQLMTREHIRHLPVIENSQLAGMISIGDVVSALIGEQASTITGLENYILGRDYNR